MTKPLANPIAFTGQSTPWSLTQLDANFTALQTAINDTLTYSNYFVDQSGVVNSVIVSIPTTLSVALTAGTVLQVKIANTNTGAATITINALVAQSIVNSNGTALQPGQLPAGGIVEFMYDGAKFQLTGGGQWGPQNYTGAINSAANALFTRTSTYSGGTVGFVTPCLEVITTVGAADANYEWGFLSVMNNSATGGNNVAIYGQGNRQTAGTGPTWAAVCEAREVIPITNPTTGLVALEVDNRSNGTDANFSRLGIDVVCTRYNVSGAVTTVGFGVRVQNNSDTTGTNCIISNGFSVWQAYVGVAFDCATSTVTTGALRMAAGQAILFDASGVNQLSYSGGLNFSVSGVAKATLLPSGAYAVGGVQVVGGRNTGWTAMTGTPDQASAFATSTVTLAQLAGRVMSLQAALTTHGLIGT
jgi:hypothetical protein